MPPHQQSRTKRQILISIFSHNTISNSCHLERQCGNLEEKVATVPRKILTFPKDVNLEKDCPLVLSKKKKSKKSSDCSRIQQVRILYDRSVFTHRKNASVDVFCHITFSSFRDILRKGTSRYTLARKIANRSRSTSPGTYNSCELVNSKKAEHS